MANETNKEHIYIVLSQTGTILSRLLRLITKKKYNHSSLSLNRELTRMYSFGRRNAYNPVWAGYVRESPHFGTFKRFPKTQICVIELEVDAQTREAISLYLETMYERHKQLHYDILGLLVAALGIRFKRRNYRYCSDFVRETLQTHGVCGAEGLKAIVHPVDFLELPGAKVIYRGMLCNYT